MLKLWGYTIVTAIAVYFLTPPIRRLAQQLKIYAKHSDRTLHEGFIPKLGGVAILLPFYAITIVLILTNKPLFGNSISMITLLAGSFIMLLLGALDDKFDINCYIKISIELIVAASAVYTGWRIDVLVFPVMGHIETGFLSWPLSILWITGIINAINLIDGLDGLAPGIIIIVALLSAAIAGVFGNMQIVYITIILAGAVLGFLRFNINPASIFMGDAGSLSLGFLLACLTLKASEATAGEVIFIIPLLLLGIPILDTLLAIIRRLRRHTHPFHSDQDHLHHRLVRLGISQAGAAMTLIGLSLILGIMALLFAQGIHTELQLFSMVKNWIQ